MKRLSILYVHASADLYGSDRVLLELVRNLHYDKARPVVVLPYSGPLGKALSDAGAEVVNIKMGVLRRKYYNVLGIAAYCLLLAYSVARLVVLIKRERIDIVHSNTSAVFAGAIAAKLCRRPHVWHVHEIVTYPKFVSKILSIAIPLFSDVVVAVSCSVKEHLAQAHRSGNGKIKVIYNALHEEDFPPKAEWHDFKEQLGLEQDDVVIGTVGRIKKDKGQTYLMEAAKKVVARHPEVKFVIVGDVFKGQESSMDELRKKISDLEIEDNVLLTGFREDAPSLLASFGVFVLPSIIPEAFPTCILEAMAVGKPVVATALGGSRELVKPNVTGYLVPTDDANAMSGAILRLVEDHNLRDSMGFAGRRRFEELFRRSEFVNKFDRLYEKMANGGMS